MSDDNGRYQHPETGEWADGRGRRMSDDNGRYHNPETGEWADERRAHHHVFRDADAHRRIDSLSESLDGKLAAVANNMKLWIVGSIGGAALTVAVAFIMPVTDKIYGQAAIDTAQNERIVFNSAAIETLRKQAEVHRAELHARMERGFDATEKRLDRQAIKLDKIFERIAAQNDPNDRRGIILPEKEAMK